MPGRCCCPTARSSAIPPAAAMLPWSTVSRRGIYNLGALTLDHAWIVANVTANGEAARE